MALHNPGKSDAGSMGSTVAKQNPLRPSILRQPKTAAQKLATVKRNFNPSSPKPTGSNQFRKN